MDLGAEEATEEPSYLGLVSNRQPKLENEPEDGLVTYMALKDVDSDLAYRACEELHRRHARRLAAWCINNRAETYGRDAIELTNLTFERAFRAAPHYCSDDELDADGRRRQVIVWLFKILRNVYLDSLRAEQREPITRDDREEADGLLEEVPKAAEYPDAGRVPPERRNLVLKFLDTLGEVDKAILIATAECWSATAAQTVLPPHIREALCSQFGLTENSLRVRRSRLLDKLRNFILLEESKPSSP